MALGQGVQVVAAAGQAARFGFALAEARQAEGLMFSQPWLDCIPDDARVDLSGLEGTLVPYQPLVPTLDEPDSAAFQDARLEILRASAGPDADPAELEQAEAMFHDHAEEFFADFRPPRRRPRPPRCHPIRRGCSGRGPTGSPGFLCRSRQ
jgi:hypothetical protein